LPIEFYFVVNGFRGHKFYAPVVSVSSEARQCPRLAFIISPPCQPIVCDLFVSCSADSGRTIRCIKAFSSAVNQLQLSSADPRTFVATSTNQIKIYDLESFVRKCEFTAKDDARITRTRMIPHDDRMFVVLNTNTICILSNALRVIRHFEPLKARRKFMQKSNQQMEKLNYIYEPADEHDDEADVDKLIKSVTRDYLNGFVVDVSFTHNGNSFCVSFLDNSLMFCSTSMWHVKRVIKFPDFYAKQCDFITSSCDDYNPDMLLTSTSNDDLMLMSLKDLNSKMLIDMNNSSSFALSKNGRVLYNVLQSGEILVYNLEQCLHKAAAEATTAAPNNHVDEMKPVRKMTDNDIKCTEPSAELDKIQMKVISTDWSTDIDSLTIGKRVRGGNANNGNRTEHLGT
jgi:hypothetical protein